MNSALLSLSIFLGAVHYAKVYPNQPWNWNNSGGIIGVSTLTKMAQSGSSAQNAKELFILFVQKHNRLKLTKTPDMFVLVFVDRRINEERG